MKKRLYLILSVFLFISASLYTTNLAEEIIFISSLYEDSYFDLALREIIKIEPRLKNSAHYNSIMLIKADILLKQAKTEESKKILQELYHKPLPNDMKAQVVLNLANIEFHTGNYNEALDLVQLFIRQFPKNKSFNSANMLLADIYFTSGQYENALESYLELENIKDNQSFSKEKTIQIYSRLAEVYLRNNDIVNAEITYRKLYDFNISQNRQFETVTQGILLKILQELEQRAEFLKIIELCPDTFILQTEFSELCLFVKISANINLKNYNEAENLLSEITDHPIVVNYYRAVIHKEKSEFHLALPIFTLLSQTSISADDKNFENLNNIKVMSFFNKIQIIARDNIDEATDKLMGFLINNPDQTWEGDIFYQLGFLQFQKRNYPKALEHLNRALNFELSFLNKQNAVYLKAETEFLLELYQESYNTFSENSELIHESLKDEAIFKKGLNLYFLNQKAEASNYFNQLISQYPFSQKCGIAYFYLGEMEISLNINQAKSYFNNALSHNMDSNIVNLRLAYIEYLLNNNEEALRKLNQVSDSQELLFDKYLLQANILFAQRNYNSALEAYRQAERNAPDQVSVEYIWARQAWTYNILKYYDTATAIYKRLAEQSRISTSGSQAGRFILSAAGTAFNSENYHQAVTLYNQFIDEYPTDENVYRAKMGLANAYFNLSQFHNAIEIWKQLVNENQSNSIIESSLKGLQASYQKINRTALFTEFLNLSILNSNKKEFIIMLYEYKANYEYEQKNYNASISTINQLLRTFPEKNEETHLMVLLANNYTWLKRYEEADKIYVNLALKNNDPYIFYEWGHIKWAQMDFVAAIRRYKRAVDNSNNEEYWITFLEKLIIVKDSTFIEYYDKFIDFASEYHKSIADFHLIEWYIYTQQFEEAMEVANLLINSSQNLFRARATLKLGELNYYLNDYQEALSNLLKVRYVFNEFSNVRWEAEYFICRVYIKQEEKQKANQLFQSIKANLNQEQITTLEQLLKG